MKVRTPQRTRKYIALIIGVALLALGGYSLLVIASPHLKQLTVNPLHNSTTEHLASSVVAEDRIYIPNIDVNVPYGETESDLLTGAWWRKSHNGNPEDGGNFILAAHRFELGATPTQTQVKSPFYSVGDLTEGDAILIDYKGKRYTYEVTKKYSVLPTQISIEDRTEAPRLTLYTCTLGGSSDGRDVIIASPLS